MPTMPVERRHVIPHQHEGVCTAAPVMACFGTKNQTIITVDASPVGVSATLAQKDPDSNDFGGRSAGR